MTSLNTCVNNELKKIRIFPESRNKNDLYDQGLYDEQHAEYACKQRIDPHMFEQMKQQKTRKNNNTFVIVCLCLLLICLLAYYVYAKQTTTKVLNLNVPDVPAATHVSSSVRYQ